MKKITILDSEANLLNDDLREFEVKFKLVLPENFKSFIKKINGGYTEDSEYVDTFNSIKYGKNTIEHIKWIHQEIEKNIPFEYLPIAADWADNPITISLKQGVDYGKIVKFYFDSDDKPEIIFNSLEELLGVKSIDEL